LTPNYYEWVKHYPRDRIQLTIIAVEIVELCRLSAILQGDGEDCDYSEDVNEKGDYGADGKINRSVLPCDSTASQENEDRYRIDYEAFDASAWPSDRNWATANNINAGFRINHMQKGNPTVGGNCCLSDSCRVAHQI
jgi:hypothetical protein